MAFTLETQHNPFIIFVCVYVDAGFSTLCIAFLELNTAHVEVNILHYFEFLYLNVFINMRDSKHVFVYIIKKHVIIFKLAR